MFIKNHNSLCEQVGFDINVICLELKIFDFLFSNYKDNYRYLYKIIVSISKIKTQNFQIKVYMSGNKILVMASVMIFNQ